MWNFSTNLMWILSLPVYQLIFVMTLSHNLLKKILFVALILAINIKITYNAIHQRHLMTGLRRKISATMRLSWKFSQSKKSWFTVCHCQLCGSFFSPCCWWAILFFILVYFWGWRKLYMKEWIKVSPTASTIT